jgi:hypothetical protein
LRSAIAPSRIGSSKCSTRTRLPVVHLNAGDPVDSRHVDVQTVRVP